MSITAQAVRTVLVTVAVCLVFAAGPNRAFAQDTEEPEKKAGSTIRGVATYADTGNPLRDAAINIVNNESGLYQGAPGGQPLQEIEDFIRAQASTARAVSLQSKDQKQIELTVSRPRK